MMKIPFNIPYLSGKEEGYLVQALGNSGKGNGSFITRCESMLSEKFGKEVYLTASCTCALEISAILAGIKPGDEVIIPSFTFPSTANAFIRQGARIVLADSRHDHPGINESGIESLINDKTRAIVPVHYGGVACDLDLISRIAEKYNLTVIEDAAHGMDGYFNGKPLGGIGNTGCLSFHRTKNLQCEEGGAIVINDNNYSDRVNNILQKGTNRKEFIEGEKERYEWVDVGSSFGMSELHASFLYAQLEASAYVLSKRKKSWNAYYHLLLPLQEKGEITLPFTPGYADHNAHIFYLILENRSRRDDLKYFLAERNIEALTHYTPLHLSDYWRKNNISSPEYDNCRKYYDRLLRLPLYNEMTMDKVSAVSLAISDFFSS